MTQLQLAQKGTVTKQMETVAKKENLDSGFICKGVAEGKIVIPANINHSHFDPCGIGQGLRTKVNANIGTSTECKNIDAELSKLKIALEAGADTIMDLSTGGNLTLIRQTIISNCQVPLGTVPIYQAGIEAINNHGAIVELREDELFNTIEAQCREGVDFITVHCGVTQRALSLLKKQTRVTDVVSRGGSFLIGWMVYHDRENPLYEHFDRLLDIALEFDVTLSLGDGLRPGCLADSTDRAQVEELVTLGELVQRAREAGVQVIVEGPGHLPVNHIAANVIMQKNVCQGAPFYVLGPLVTDIAAGYDHITGAIGGAVAAAAGADFLCYVTPSEHLSLPGPEDVRLGVIASRIAAHAADISKEVKGAIDKDRQMSEERKRLDWSAQKKIALDPDRFEVVCSQSSNGACSMCGSFCAMQIVEKHLGVDVRASGCE